MSGRRVIVFWKNRKPPARQPGMIRRCPRGWRSGAGRGTVIVSTDTNRVYRMSINGRRAGWRRVGAEAGCVILAQLAAAVSLHGQQSAKAVARGPVAGTRETLLAVNHVRVPSKAFNTARDIFIWQPDAESPTAAKYPVLVFPDAEETGQFRAALANVQFLIDRQLIPPMIVVGIPYLANRSHELSPTATGTTAKNYPNAGGADQTLQFIVGRATAVGRRAVSDYAGADPGRAFTGRAARAVRDGSRPDVFRIVIAMSPAVFWNGGATGELDRAAARDGHRPAADPVRHERRAGGIH